MYVTCGADVLATEGRNRANPREPTAVDQDMSVFRTFTVPRTIARHHRVARLVLRLDARALRIALGRFSPAFALVVLWGLRAGLVTGEARVVASFLAHRPSIPALAVAAFARFDRRVCGVTALYPSGGRTVRGLEEPFTFGFHRI